MLEVWFGNFHNSWCFFNLQMSLFDSSTDNCLSSTSPIHVRMMYDQSLSSIKNPVCTVYPIYFTVTGVLILSITYRLWHLSWERLWFESFQVIATFLNYLSHQGILQKKIHLPYLGMDVITLWRELSVYYRHARNSHQRKYSVLFTNVQLKTFQHVSWLLSLDTAGLWYRCCILKTAFLICLEPQLKYEDL